MNRTFDQKLQESEGENLVNMWEEKVPRIKKGSRTVSDAAQGRRCG